MIFQSPGAILFKLGPATVRWYGILIAVGFSAALFAATKLAKRLQVNVEALSSCALIAFISGIIGARLYYVFLKWQTFSGNPSEIFATWHGGLSIHGGIIGGIVAGFVFCRIRKHSFFRFCDIFAACIPLGQAIGRWGNFFNSELFGGPVPDNFPLKLFIAEEHRPLGFHEYSYFHPTFLYESVWDLLLFAVLYFYCAPKLKTRPGITTCLYLIGYSIGRLLIEPLRLDSIKVSGVQVPMIASMVGLIIGLLGIAALIRRKA